RRRLDGLRRAGRGAGQAAIPAAHGAGLRRRRLLPDERPGVRHRRAVRCRHHRHRAGQQPIRHHPHAPGTRLPRPGGGHAIAQPGFRRHGGGLRRTRRTGRAHRRLRPRVRARPGFRQARHPALHAGPACPVARARLHPVRLMSAAPHVVVIGAGAVGAATAVQARNAGLRVTLVESGEPGGRQAASYGNAGWLSSHSILPPAAPGVWKQVPKWVRDPLGPLAVRAGYLPRALPWLARYLASAWTWPRVERTAHALRTLLADAPALHQALAAQAGVPHLIEQRGLLHAYLSEQQFRADARAWEIRRREGIRWQELDTAALRAREPDLHPRYTFGVLVPETGHCRDPGA